MKGVIVMEELFVDSSMITRIKYYFDQSILEIEFKSSGQVWNYFDFPESLWHDFKVAESQGKFFHREIKNQYRESRVA
jgi:hypothetical protein